MVRGDSSGDGSFHALDLGRVRAISFDFYGTLVFHRTGRGRGAELMRYLDARGLESDPWEHQVLYDLFARHHERYDPAWPEPRKRAHREWLARRAFRRLRVRAPLEVAAEHADPLWERLGPASLAVFPDALEILEGLRTEAIPVAVVSNWQCGLRHFCRELGLYELVDAVVASAEVGSEKPEPRIFREACRGLGVPAGHVLHVGDTLAADLEGAMGAGLQALLIHRENEPPQPPVPWTPNLRSLLDRLRKARAG